MRARNAVVLGCALCLAAAACSSLLDLQPPPDQSADAGSTTDATTPVDTGTMGGDSGTEGSADVGDAPSDSGKAEAEAGPSCTLILDAALPDGATDAATVFNRMTDVVFDDAGDMTWQFFDLTSVSIKADNFAGGAFDGRYVYLVPQASSIVTRYDTHLPFSKGASYQTYDTTALGANAADFQGAVFDGRFVYFVPHHGGGATDPGLFVRFDTTATSFGQSSAWSTFDTTTLAADAGTPARNFNFGVFDGRYVYFVPDTDGSNPVGRVARYDTQGTDGGTTPVDAGTRQFGTASQWTTFDVSSTDHSALGFRGAVYDGKYVYLVPWNNGGGTNNGASGVLSRFDTAGTFTSGTSWTSFDLTQLNATQGAGFWGGAFDGRYVYLVPFNRSLALRFDTQKGLSATQSWDRFDLSTFVQLPEGGTATFAGAAFDGRFVYYVPSNSGLVVRRDTLPGGCWYIDDISKLNASATGFFGAVYDGQYLYLIPTKGYVIARFDTKSPAWMPNLPAFYGSFL